MMQRVSLWWMLRYGAARGGIGTHDVFFNSIAGLYLASYNLPNTVIGLLANERSLIGSPLLPILGALSDRLRTPLGRRKPFMLLSLVAVIGFLALIPRPATWVVVLIFLLGPLFLSTAAMAYEVLLPDCVPPEQRGTANGLARALGFGSGIVLLLLAFQLWESQPGAIFLLVAVALLVGFAITMASVSEPESARQGREPGGEVVVELPLRLQAQPGRHRPARTTFSLAALQGPDLQEYLRNILSQRQAARYVLCYFFVWFAAGGITPFLTRFGVVELGIPAGETFLLVVAALVTTALFVTPAGWLGDHLGKKRVTSWGLLLSGLLILVASQVQTKEQAVIAMAIAGIGQAIPTALAYPLFTELVPARRMGELTGISTMIWSLAQPLGATTFGAIADLTGSLRSVLIGGALSLLLAAAILQTVGSGRVRA